MNSMKKLSVNISADMHQKLALIASECEKSLDYVIERALNFYLMHEGKDILDFKEGRDQIAAGDYEDIDDVLVDMKRIIAGELDEEEDRKADILAAAIQDGVDSFTSLTPEEQANMEEAHVDVDRIFNKVIEEECDDFTPRPH